MVRSEPHLARKSVQSEDTLGGMGGGLFDVATWNSAAMLFVNSGHGGLPVAEEKMRKRQNC